MWQKISFALLEKHDKSIIFLIPGTETKSGGILSIFSIFRETISIFKNKRVSVLMMSYPNSAKISKYTWFDNNVSIYPFDLLIKKRYQGIELIIHLPEYYVGEFFDLLSCDQIKTLSDFKNVHFNILNQNIEMMPDKIVIDRLRVISNRITSTTAHDSYTNAYFRDYYGLPIHKLSSWFDKEKVLVLPYELKEDILIVSPDSHPLKQYILNYIAQKIPKLKFVIIRDMRYEDYKLLESKAKWSISFGEGLDGYIVGPTLRGGIGFAVYNKEFFTEEFLNLPNIFDNFDTLAQNVVSFIENNDTKLLYENVRLSAYEIIDSKFNYHDFKNNVKLFYEEKYTIP
ncbi:hypothetical protein HMJ29_11620 [Hymenobacter taeanensis]|uniref:Glycosyltransferase family 1 protein n=2 Tax=Hymenobacter TaxID=89966 RepID=A0A6M6BHV0_9BACT|nr:hypothetical protein [Hymenobacter taeanensis]QJX47552.1 hypothetical protein HMJ29_11620 [Hymenobacter taeanensis]